jgi:hypothetical protein
MIACDLFSASSTALLEEPMPDRIPTIANLDSGSGVQIRTPGKNKVFA